MPPGDDATVDGGEGQPTLAGDATLDPDGPALDDTAAADVAHETHAGVREPPRPTITPGLSPGGEVGRYVVLERVGAGAMGEVYGAYDPELDRRVALKVLRPERSGSPHRRARLLREAQSIARLDHPNVIGVYDVGEVDGKLYLAMEFADGGTLTRWLAEGGRDHRDVLARLCEAGAGLAAAHRAGVVHRDFKPDNVLLTSDGRVKVADFGIARLASAAPDPSVEEVSRESRATRAQMVASRDEAMTKTGDTVGTPLYMAPEQHALSPGDDRSDQYAFCVTCWEALTGRRPFRGDGLGALVVAKLEERIDEPGDTTVPSWVLRLLRRGLAADPAARWPSVAELVAKLQDDPRRRRRRWLGLTGLVAAGALLGAVPGWTRPVAADDPCPSDATEVEEVYGEAERQAVRDAFARVDASWAGPVERSTLASLDRWSVQWVDTSDRACRATWVEHEASLDLLTARRACLEQAQRQLGVTVTWASEAKADELRNAITRVAALPQLESCWEEGQLRHWLELPEDPAGRRAAVALYEDIKAFGEQLRLTERAERERRGAELMARALELGVPTYAANIRLKLARLREREGDVAGAREEYETLMWEAIARDDSGGAYAAALELLWIDGYIKADPDRAKSSEAAARSLLQRLGDPPRRRAELLSRMGAVHYGRGDPDASAATYQEALDVYTPVTLGERLQHADLRFNLASIRIERGELDGALHQFDELLQMWTELVGPDHPELVSLLTNRAIAYERHGDLDAAAADAERAFRICAANGDAPADQCINVGRVLATSRWRGGRPDEAIEALTHTHALQAEALGPDDRRTLQSELMLGHFLALQGRREALEQRAAVARGDDEHARQVGTIFGALAAEAEGDRDGAAAVLAEVIAELEPGTWAHTIVAIARARMLAAAGRPDDALTQVGPLANGEIEVQPEGRAMGQLAWATIRVAMGEGSSTEVEAQLRTWHGEWVDDDRRALASDIAVFMAQHGWTP